MVWVGELGVYFFSLNILNLSLLLGLEPFKKFLVGGGGWLRAIFGFSLGPSLTKRLIIKHPRFIVKTQFQQKNVKIQIIGSNTSLSARINYKCDKCGRLEQNPTRSS